MKRFFFCLVMLAGLLLASGQPVLAQKSYPYNNELTNPYNTSLGSVGDTLPKGYATQSQDPFEVVERVLRIAFSFLGIATISLMVYAGFLWMTAGGNDDQVSNAKATMRNAVIGLILIMSAYSITWFVATRIQRTTGSYGRPVSPSTGAIQN